MARKSLFLTFFLVISIHLLPSVYTTDPPKTQQDRPKAQQDPPKALEDMTTERFNKVNDSYILAQNGAFYKDKENTGYYQEDGTGTFTKVDDVTETQNPGGPPSQPEKGIFGKAWDMTKSHKYKFGIATTLVAAGVISYFVFFRQGGVKDAADTDAAVL